MLALFVVVWGYELSEEILINVTPAETRVAVVENGVLQEIYIERSASRGMVGNIYQGKVVRVLPGMQAAFIDIGLQRACFIHVNDLSGPALVRGDEYGNHSSAGSSIRDLLHDGQALMVQIVKDPIGTKGARVTSQLSLSSRFLVYMSRSNLIGVSQRIEDEQERQRLRDLVATLSAHESMASDGGYIVRTAAEGVGPDELRADMIFLHKLWESVQHSSADVVGPGIVYRDLPLPMRTIRDLVWPPVEKIRIDSQEAFQSMVKFATAFTPEVVPRIEHYGGARPIFDLFSVEDEIQKALDKKVKLKSGGYLIIDQTEAMATIDVNTGAFVGHRNLEETIYKTNLEAVNALARQLRVRNLGGMIIIDLIDMSDPEHQRQVMRVLEKALEKDHARTTISSVSELSLVQMTRKRTRESLGQILCEPCAVCEGRGTLKSAETVCYQVFRDILREARAYENRNFLVLAASSVVDRLLDEDSAHVMELEEFIGATIQFQVETVYSQEQFDVILL
jgi:ribonuclease G